MRYLLVDRIIEWKAGEKIKGIKNVAMSEDFFEHHFPKNPIMPGVLLLEAAVQLAGWLEAVSSEFQNWFLLTRVRRAMFYGFTLPGDSLELEVKCLQRDSKSRSFSGICAVGGKKRIVAEFDGDVFPLAGLEDVTDQKRRFQFLTRSELFK